MDRCVPPLTRGVTRYPDRILHPAPQVSSAFGGESGPSMTTLVNRQFTVDRPLEQAWQYFCRAERWPTWAKHIRQVELQPPGEVGPNTTGRLVLNNGVKAVLTVTEFNPLRNWKWVGRFLWLTIYFDHRFEELNPTQTRLTWIVEAKGLGMSVFRRLLARFYRQNLDRAIPLLIEEMRARRE